jgi:Rha family phage regulatory protein
MADATALPAAITEVALPILSTAGSQVTATSIQIAEHFDKRHANVLRAISNLECSPEFSQLNFELANYIDEQGKPRQMYRVTRDGFAFLAMGFTGKEAARWKEAYIRAFNLMEAKLRSLYEFKMDEDARMFRNGMKLKTFLTLRDQSNMTLDQLQKEEDPQKRCHLYRQLKFINNTVGWPTSSAAQLLGADAPLLLTVSQEGGAA